MLKWWHYKLHTSMGQFLPEIQLPETDGDAAFLFSCMLKDLIAMSDTVDSLMRSKTYSKRKPELKHVREDIELARAMLVSVALYFDKLLAKEC